MKNTLGKKSFYYHNRNQDRMSHCQCYGNSDQKEIELFPHVLFYALNFGEIELTKGFRISPGGR